MIGTFTVNYSSNIPPITLEIVPGSVLFDNTPGNISNTTEQVLATVGVPELVLLGLGLGLAMLATLRPAVAHPRQR